MLNKVWRIGFVLGVLGLLVPTLGLAEPPPAGVNEVVVKMLTFETAYQNGTWDEAKASLQTIEKTIKDVFMQAQIDDFVLEEALMELQKNVAAMDGAKVDESFKPFQKQYFNYVSHFDHEIHPILVKIEAHVTKQAPNAFAANNHAGMLSEMQEAAMLIDHGKAVLIKKGVPELEINGYASKVQALGFAVKANNQEKVAEILTDLQETYATFMEKYKN